MIVTCESTSSTMSLLVASREVFRMARTLSVRNGNIRPTLSFLQDISAILKKKGIECDTTAAWQFWQLIVEASDAFAEEMDIESEIAWHYHIDPTGLSEKVKLGLERNIVRNQARQKLANGDYSPTDYESVYSLAIIATGDEDYAQKLKTEAFKRYIEQQTKRGAK